MLNFFRQRGLSNVLYGAIIIATILTFVIEFRPNASNRTASLKETCVARVRGRCISPKDFGAAYRMLNPSRSSDVSRKLGLKQAAIDGLVERELLVDEAGRLGISATEDEVTDQLYKGFIRVSVPAADPRAAMSVYRQMYMSYVQNGLVPRDIAQAHANERDPAIPIDFRDSKTKSFDMKLYERQVRNLSNRSTVEFREEQERELIAAKMRDVVRAPVRVSDEEAWGVYDRRESTAAVTWIPVKETWAARWAVQAKPADVDAWAKDHPSEVDTMVGQRDKDDAPKAGHLRQIFVQLRYGTSDDDKAVALAKLSWAAARIRAGEPFAEVARDVSEDPSSAPQGGDVGENGDGLSTGRFAASADALKAAAAALKPGETSATAIETQFGYHLLEKDDPARAAAVTAQLKHTLSRALYRKAKGLDAAKALAARIGDAIRGGKSADDAIKEVVDTATRGDADAAGAAGRRIGRDTLRVVSGDAADAGGPPRAAASDAGAPSGTLPDKRFDATTDPDAPATQTSSAFHREGEPFPGLSPEGTTAVLDFAFNGKEKSVIGDPVRVSDGFAVVQLKQRKIATRSDFDKNRTAVEEVLVREKRDEALSLYVKRLRSQAKDAVKIDESYVQELKTDGGAGGDEDEEEN
jgi:peptidyl-prolyl cis-trans isomerase D